MILVTGATGCIGTNLTRALVERGDRVAILCPPGEDLSTLGQLADTVEVRYGDVRDPAAVERAMRGVTAVFHLAGVAVQSNTLARRMREVNVGGTENVMRAAAGAGARVVHTSSVSAIGLPDDGELADEDFPFNGHRFRNAYVNTKAQGEEVVRRYVANGLDAVILNPGAVMAPGGDLRYGWPNFVLRVAAGKFPRYPTGGVAMVARADLVTAYLRALERGRTGERYIVTTANVLYRDLIAMVAQEVDASPPKGPLPDRLVVAVAWLCAPIAPLIRDPYRRPLLVPENIPLLTRRLYYRNDKARRELGLVPTSMANAIAEVADWCRAKGALAPKDPQLVD
jgi:Nucleoside-diphosphate-sugar epimerases